jgi:hypothetical protein
MQVERSEIPSPRALKGEAIVWLLQALNNPPEADKRSSKIPLKAGR